MTALIQQRCQPIPKGSAALSVDETSRLLLQIDQWTLITNPLAIEREFRFKNYYETQAFVNAVVWIAHREDHHPDISFGYNRGRVRYNTHSVGGLSINDFICAAKIDALLH
ncbi:MAG: 4a-hydroxytetrahydrobiopterin dehydratase [Gammaproteobacteria bacterium]|nr:4a-hydroxytetrahydrobiopterin dehydratase [Gammaproteobacteria bacterium]